MDLAHSIAVILFVFGCYLAAWAFFRFWVPWCVQRIVLYGLHNLRDDLYIEALETPGLANTQMYRLSEKLITTAIHVVRDCEHLEAVEYAVLLHEKPDLRALDLSRVKLMVEELIAVPNATRVIATISSAVRTVPRYLAVYSLSGNSWTAPILLLVGLVGLARSVFGDGSSSDHDGKVLSQMLTRAEHPRVDYTSPPSLQRAKLRVLGISLALQD